MIGIYKITNKINGKFYIGQSNDIMRRFGEHKTQKHNRILVDQAIQKYGINNFIFEIIEECSLDELNEKESYWIKKLDAIKNGCNLSKGGHQQSIGSNNGRAKLTEQDIIEIRTAYANHERQAEVYKKFQNKISFSSFQAAWQGQTWAHIMPEVYTQENKNYYIYQNSRGEKGASAGFTDEQVIELRKQYVNKSARELYKPYQEKMAYNTFQAMLWGRTYKYLPIYKKKEKKWINI